MDMNAVRQPVSTPVTRAALRRRDRLARILVAGLLGAAVLGCGGPGARDRRWDVKAAAAPDPVGEARALVQRFADGAQIGSEAEGFPDLVRRVTEADADKGAKLKKLLETRGGPDAAAAKTVLKDL